MNKLIVALYKWMGFGLLLTIVGGMFFYLSTTLFFFFNERWVIPLILSPQHAKVSEAQIGYMQQTYQLKKLEAEKVAIKDEIDYIEFASSIHGNFYKTYQQAIDFELIKDKRRLFEISRLLERYRKAAQASEERQVNLGDSTAQNLESQFNARLIDKSQLLNGQYMLSQLDLSSLNRQERLAQLEQRRESLEQNVNSYLILTRNDNTVIPNESKITPSILTNHHQLLQSMVEKVELESKLASLKLRISSLDKLLDNYRRIIQNLEQSPYIRASQAPVTVALVPYDNLSNVKENEPVFTCYLEFVFCQNVGTIKSIFPGEVSMKNPIRSEEIRGKMIELKLTNNAWGESRALMIGMPPLFF